MASVSEILAKLPAESAGRVVRWLSDRFNLGARTFRGPDSVRGDASVAVGELKDLAAFFAAAGPSTETAKALVTSYWLQQVAGNADLDAQQVNAELKDLGHGVSNITRAFDRLIGQRPQLVIQTRKSGVAKQARKKYRVTTEGIHAVEEMLRKSGSEEG